jgi:hypothetical protein
MARGWKSFAWLAAPAITVALILVSPLRVSGGDTLPGSVGGLAFHCSALSRLETIDAVARLAEGGGSLPYWMVRDTDGAIVSTWGPGPQVLGSLGFTGVAEGSVLSADEIRARSRRVAAVWLAIGIAIIAWWLSRTLPPLRAAGAALVLAVSFAAAPTLGEAVWQATVAIVPLLLGLVIVMRPEGRLRLLAPAALLLAASLRPAVGLLAVGLGVQWLLVRPRWTWRQLAIAAAVAVVAVLPLCLWNLAHWGTIAPVGQWHASQQASSALVSFGPAPLARGLAGLVVSPARGVVWFAPLALVGAVVAWRSSLRAIALACAAQLVFIASWYDWWGGGAFGPRLLGEVTLVLGAIALADRGARVPRWVVVVTAGWTAAIGMLGIFRWDPSQWEARHPDTGAVIWNVVDSPLIALVHSPQPMRDWLDSFSYRCTDVGVEADRLSR